MSISVVLTPVVLSPAVLPPVVLPPVVLPPAVLSPPHKINGPTWVKCTCRPGLNKHRVYFVLWLPQTITVNPSPIYLI